MASPMWQAWRPTLVRFSQPVAMGVLLGQGWHVYSEVLARGSLLGLALCSAAVVLGLAVGLLLCSRAAPGEATLGLSLFWMSCVLNGGLASIAQLRQRSGRFPANDDALVVNSFLASGLLGTSLPHMAFKVSKQADAEVLLPCALAILVTEALCNNESYPLLKVAVSTFLCGAGIQGMVAGAGAAGRGVPVGAHPGKPDALHGEVGRRPLGGAPAGPGAVGAPAAAPVQYEPFFPATVVEARRYSPNFLVRQKAHCVPRNVPVVPLVSLVARQASEAPPRGGKGKGPAGKDRSSGKLGGAGAAGHGRSAAEPTPVGARVEPEEGDLPRASAVERGGGPRSPEPPPGRGAAAPKGASQLLQQCRLGAEGDDAPSLDDDMDVVCVPFADSAHDDFQDGVPNGTRLGSAPAPGDADSEASIVEARLTEEGAEDDVGGAGGGGAAPASLPPAAEADAVGWTGGDWVPRGAGLEAPSDAADVGALNGWKEGFDAYGHYMGSATWEGFPGYGGDMQHGAWDAYGTAFGGSSHSGAYGEAQVHHGAEAPAAAGALGTGGEASAGSSWTGGDWVPAGDAGMMANGWKEAYGGGYGPYVGDATWDGYAGYGGDMQHPGPWNGYGASYAGGSHSASFHFQEQAPAQRRPVADSLLDPGEPDPGLGRASGVAEDGDDDGLAGAGVAGASGGRREARRPRDPTVSSLIDPEHPDPGLGRASMVRAGDAFDDRPGKGRRRGRGDGAAGWQPRGPQAADPNRWADEAVGDASGWKGGGGRGGWLGPDEGVRRRRGELGAADGMEQRLQQEGYTENGRAGGKAGRGGGGKPGRAGQGHTPAAKGGGPRAA